MDIKLKNTEQVSINQEEALYLIQDAEFIHWYDSLPAGCENRIDIFDLALPAFLSAVPNFKRFLDDFGIEKLQRSLSIASSHLSQIPNDISLHNWPDNYSNRQLLISLFNSTTGYFNKSLPSYGPAACTKLLHKKRPQLIPIIDSWQFAAWDENPQSKYYATGMVEIVFKIKSLVGKNIDEYISLQEVIKDSFPHFPMLSVIRLYDIIFWQLSNKLPKV